MSQNLLKSMYKIVLCAIFKNEAPYILEWIAYHRAIKVDHFVIYDNESTDGTQKILKQLERAGIITYVYWPSKPDRDNQSDAYRDATQIFLGKCEWIGFLDGDEFIVPHRHRDLHSFLYNYQNVAGIAINWKIFGSSEHTSKIDGLVMERFTRCAASDFSVNGHFKTIAKIDSIEDVAIHICKFKKNHQKYVYPDRKTVAPDSVGHGTHIDHSLIQVNHYFTKSREEWELKRARGKANVPPNVPIRFKLRSDRDFDGHDRNEEEDLQILRFLVSTRQEINFLNDILALEKTDAQILKPGLVSAESTVQLHQLKEQLEHTKAQLQMLQKDLKKLEVYYHAHVKSLVNLLLANLQVESIDPDFQKMAIKNKSRRIGSVAEYCLQGWTGDLIQVGTVPEEITKKLVETAVKYQRQMIVIEPDEYSSCDRLINIKSCQGNIKRVPESYLMNGKINEITENIFCLSLIGNLNSDDSCLKFINAFASSSGIIIVDNILGNYQLESAFQTGAKLTGRSQIQFPIFQEGYLLWPYGVEAIID